MRVAEMNWRTMYGRKPRRYLNPSNGIRGLERPHGDPHRTRERTGRRAGDVGPVHGDADVAFDVTDRQIVRHQGLLERERATQNKRHQIVAPMLDDVGRFFHHLTVAPYTITRHIGADIQVEPERGNAGAST